MPQSSGPEITNASKGAHFLENVISIADMTHEPSTSSALLIAEYNIPTRNNKNRGIAVIKSKDNHVISTANINANKPE